MKYEELPKEMQEAYDGLKENFLSIQCEVEDALDDAKTLDEFKQKVADRMKALHNEAGTVANLFAKIEKEQNLKERDMLLFGEEIDYCKELGGRKDIKNISLSTLKTLLEKGFIALDDKGTENGHECSELITALEVSPEKLTVSGHAHSDRIDLDYIEGKTLYVREMNQLVWLIHGANDYTFDIVDGKLSASWE